MNNNKSSGALVWGSILLGLGLLFLAKTIGWFSIEWGELLRFWPLLVVGAGLSLLANKQWSGSLAAVLIALTIPAGIIGGTKRVVDKIKEDVHIDLNDNDDDDDYESDNSIRKYSNQFSESLPANIATASLDFGSGAGKFRIGGSTNELIEASAESDFGTYFLTNKRNEADKNAALSLKMEDKDSIKIDIDEWENKRNKVEMSLSDKPVWTINVGMGAGKGDFDLSDYKVKLVKLETGVSEVDLKLGDKSDLTEVNIKSGVASIDIEIPESVGCEFVSSSALSIEKLEDFNKINKDTHRTPNYDKATKKIKINYEGGLSRIKIRRY